MLQYVIHISFWLSTKGSRWSKQDCEQRSKMLHICDQHMPWDQSKTCGGILCSSVSVFSFHTWFCRVFYGIKKKIFNPTHNPWDGKPHVTVFTHLSKTTTYWSVWSLFPIKHRCSNTCLKTQNKRHNNTACFYSCIIKWHASQIVMFCIWESDTVLF